MNVQETWKRKERGVSQHLAGLGTGLAVGIVGVLFLFRNLLGKDIRATLWGSNFDNNLVYWMFEWSYHVLFESFDWANFWNANSFYPHSNTLAFSDALLSPMLLYGPLRLAGLVPLPAIYLTLAGVCVLACMLSGRALYRIGCFNGMETAAIVYVSHFGLSMVAFLPGHLQLFGFQFAPPFFLFLFLYLRDWKLTDLTIACLAFLAGASFSVYLAPMAAAAALLPTIYFTGRSIRKFGLMAFLRKLGYRVPLIVLSAAGILFFVVIRHYLPVNKSFPADFSIEQRGYSARPLSIIVAPPACSRWHYGKAPALGSWEYAYSPGRFLLGLAFLSLVAQSTAHLLRRRKISAARNSCGTLRTADKQCLSRRIPADLLLYSAGFLCIAWMLSLGPVLNILGVEFKTPFYLLNRIVPGFESLRAPGRFGMFIGLPMAVLAMSLFPALLTGRTRAVLGGAALLLLVADAWCTFPVYAFSIAHKDFYSRAAGHIVENEPVLVLPASDRDYARTVRLHMEQLKGSTIHWGRIVTGHGSRLTPEIGKLRELDNRFQSGRADVNSLLNFARRLHIRKVAVFLSDYGIVPRQKMEEYLSSPDAGRILVRDKDAVLFSLPD